MSKKLSRSKKCGRCGEIKSLDEFTYRDKAKKKQRGICRTCENEHKANWYKKNRETHIKNVAVRKKKAREKVRAFISDYLSTHPCVDCGESNQVVLEFDHIRGKKRKNIGNMITQGYSIKAIEKEIAKCEVRCANCHRIKTAEEQGWYKS